MHFAPDTDAVLEFDVAFVNTEPAASRSGTDELTTKAELREFYEAYQFSGRYDGDDEELAQARESRSVIRRMWTLDRDDMVEAVNALLAQTTFLPHLQRHDGLDWHLHATPPDAPFAERIKVEAALALVDVIRTGETDRLRVCEADDCEGLLADLSRNRSKRFCSVRCGNRMNMVAFRERQSAG